MSRDARGGGSGNSDGGGRKRNTPEQIEKEARISHGELIQREREVIRNFLDDYTVIVEHERVFVNDDVEVNFGFICKAILELPNPDIFPDRARTSISSKNLEILIDALKAIGGIVEVLLKEGLIPQEKRQNLQEVYDYLLIRAEVFIPVDRGAISWDGTTVPHPIRGGYNREIIAHANTFFSMIESENLTPEQMSPNFVRMSTALKDVMTGYIKRAAPDAALGSAAASAALLPKGARGPGGEPPTKR